MGAACNGMRTGTAGATVEYPALYVLRDSRSHVSKHRSGCCVHTGWREHVHAAWLAGSRASPGDRSLSDMHPVAGGILTSSLCVGPFSCKTAFQHKVFALIRQVVYSLRCEGLLALASHKSLTARGPIDPRWGFSFIGGRCEIQCCNPSPALDTVALCRAN